MLDFNLWCWNSRVFPGIDPLVVRKDDKVRVRFGNLTMTNHPIHMHGYEFKVTGTDGGWVPEEAAWPEVSIDVRRRPDAGVRVRGRRTRRLGDPLPQVAPYDERHGPRREDLYRRRQEGDRPAPSGSSCPATCPWARTAWARWARWRCRCPTTPLPMMTGFAQFGPVEMGGMFSVVKVREGLASGRLQGSRLVQESARHGRSGVHRGPADASTGRQAGERQEHG